MAEQNQAVTRVSNYPVVRDTWNKVSEIYQQGKNGSTIIRLCGNIAESSASLALKASQPVLEKLPVSTVNDYAVRQLDNLEQRYPSITKPTDEMVEAVKSFSLGKLDECKTYGTNQFNRLAEVARLNAVLDIADATVDKFLPPIPNEEGVPDKSEDEVATKKPTEASGKLQYLSNKVRRRAFDNAMSKVGTLQKRSQESIGKLRYTVDLIDYARENIKDLTIDDCKMKVQEYYNEITRDEMAEETLSKDATIEKKTLFVARKLTLRARTSFRTVSKLGYALPAYVRSQVYDAVNYAESLLHTFTDATSFKDFTAEMSAQIKQKLNLLEEAAGKLSDFVLQAAPVRWLVVKGKDLISRKLDEKTELDDDDDESETSAQNTTFDDPMNSTYDAE